MVMRLYAGISYASFGLATHTWLEGFAMLIFEMLHRVLTLVASSYPGSVGYARSSPLPGIGTKLCRRMDLYPRIIVF